LGLTQGQLKLIELDERVKIFRTHVITLYNLFKTNSLWAPSLEEIIQKVIEVYKALRKDIMSFFSDDPAFGSIPSGENLKAEPHTLLILSSYTDLFLDLLKDKKSLMLGMENIPYQTTGTNGSPLNKAPCC